MRWYKGADGRLDELPDDHITEMLNEPDHVWAERFRAWNLTIHPQYQYENVREQLRIELLIRAKGWR